MRLFQSWSLGFGVMGLILAASPSLADPGIARFLELFAGKFYVRYTERGSVLAEKILGHRVRTEADFEELLARARSGQIQGAEARVASRDIARLSETLLNYRGLPGDLAAIEKHLGYASKQIHLTLIESVRGRFRVDFVPRVPPSGSLGPASDAAAYAAARVRFLSEQVIQTTNEGILHMMQLIRQARVSGSRFAYDSSERGIDFYNVLLPVSHGQEAVLLRGKVASRNVSKEDPLWVLEGLEIQDGNRRIWLQYVDTVTVRGDPARPAYDRFSTRFLGEDGRLIEVSARRLKFNRRSDPRGEPLWDPREGGLEVTVRPVRSLD